MNFEECQQVLLGVLNCFIQGCPEIKRPSVNFAPLLVIYPFLKLSVTSFGLLRVQAKIGLWSPERNQKKRSWRPKVQKLSLENKESVPGGTVAANF